MSAKQRKNRCHLKRTAAIGFGFHSVASSYHPIEDPNCDRGLRSAAPAKMKNFHDVKMSVMSAKQRKKRSHLKRTAAIGFGFYSVASSYHPIEDPNCDRGLRSAAPAKMKNFHDVKMSVMSAKQRKNRSHLKRTAAIGFGFHSVASSYHSVEDPNCDRGLRSAAPAKMKKFSRRQNVSNERKAA